MIKEKTDIIRLKRYLLNDLPAAEIEEIDLRIISDRDFEDELLQAESELIEDYLEEVFTPKERQLFLNNFLVSPERRLQFRQISRLKNYAQNIYSQETVNQTEISNHSLAEQLKKFLSFRWRTATAVCALLIVGLLSFFYLTGNFQTAPQKEFARLNRKDLSNLEEFRQYKNVNLASGVFRNSNETVKLQENTLGENAIFRLALPNGFSDADRFRADITKDDKNILSLDGIASYANPNGREIRLVVHSAELKKGNYQIKLTGEINRDSFLIYNFAVE